MRHQGRQRRKGFEDGPRLNDQIRAEEVRVIGDDGNQYGVLPIREALEKAEEVGLDLVEVSPDAQPPVCRLIDYGKFKYQQSKKAQEAKKKQAVVDVKEITMTPNTDKHDIDTKRNHVKRWIADKSRVRISVRFRGRELSHMENGHRVIDELLSEIDDLVQRDAPPKLEGRRLVVNISPRAEKK